MYNANITFYLEVYVHLGKWTSAGERNVQNNETYWHIDIKSVKDFFLFNMQAIVIRIRDSFPFSRLKLFPVFDRNIQAHVEIVLFIGTKFWRIFWEYHEKPMHFRYARMRYCASAYRTFQLKLNIRNQVYAYFPSVQVYVCVSIFIFIFSFSFKYTFALS